LIKALLEADKTYEFYMILTDNFTLDGYVACEEETEYRFGSAVDPNFTLLGNESE
jgi:hypothetical protein